MFVLRTDNSSIKFDMCSLLIMINGLTTHQFTVKYRYNAFKFITYGTALIVTESESDFRITVDTHILLSRSTYGVSIVRIW